MVYFAAPNKTDEQDEDTFKGRQAILNYLFSIMTYQRDAITIFDSLKTIKDEVETIDKKVDDNIDVILATIQTTNRLKSSDHSNSNQGIDEEQKMLDDGSYSKQEDSGNKNAPIQIYDRQQIKSYKENVKSIQNQYLVLKKFK